MCKVSFRKTFLNNSDNNFIDLLKELIFLRKYFILFLLYQKYTINRANLLDFLSNFYSLGL